VHLSSPPYVLWSLTISFCLVCSPPIMSDCNCCPYQERKLIISFFL
jgi:hypothetical protein